MLKVGIECYGHVSHVFLNIAVDLRIISFVSIPTAAVYEVSNDTDHAL